jgi:hypothetical protein
MSLIYLKLSVKKSQIKGRRDLADTAAVGIDE